MPGNVTAVQWEYNVYFPGNNNHCRFFVTACYSWNQTASNSIKRF